MFVFVFHQEVLQVVEVVLLAGVAALHHLGVFDLAGEPVDACPLVVIFDSHVLRALAPIKLNQRCTVPATEARMVSIAEPVELPSHFLEVLAKRSEDH